ncbi:MFS transporter [Diaphorobacter ruginosibacter]|uniref:MFS transporter n=1 Tax=Diaphorobacter ruginosibacter TaxID=1715720 RepID=A0A7G9RJA0_9BURK|nr:MFS transporter [Diaphorobacter ruginosibacter]QNN55675.1 MFS transporter [Diaphorobacter ruginosibacter]
MITPQTNDGSPVQFDSTVSRPRAWFAFAMIFLLMMSDYIDRQIIVSLFPHLKEEWGLSDKQLGGLVSVISIVVALGSIPVALLADRFGRVKSIFVMASIWSAATIACMFARNYSQLFAARAVVGLGETGYGSVGSALISALFPKRLHATLLGAFFGASSVGAVLGVVLGGVIAEHWGWRAAFGAVGFPGLLMALGFLLVPDYKNVIVKIAPTLDSKGPASHLTRMFKTLSRGPTMWVLCVAGSFQMIVVSAIWSWAPSFFNRYHGMPPATAAKYAAVLVLFGALGAMFWGWVADRISRERGANKLVMLCVTTSLTAALFIAAFTLALPQSSQFVLILAAASMMTCTVGVSVSAILDVTNPGLRSTGAAVHAFAINLFGLAVGPFLGGVISDHWGLQTALAVIPAAGFLASIFYWKASRSYEADARVAAGTVQQESPAEGTGGKADDAPLGGARA